MADNGTSFDVYMGIRVWLAHLVPNCNLLSVAATMRYTRSTSQSSNGFPACKAARAAGSEEDAAVGKTALVDMTLHLDPDLAKHKIGRAIMQKLEDTFGQPGLEGPGIELGQRLPLSPFRSISSQPCGSSALKPCTH